MIFDPFTVETEFKKFCGPDVTYVSDHLGEGTHARRLFVKFTVNGTDVAATAYRDMPNTTGFSKRDATLACAKQASDFAYRTTGKREADLKALMQGKVRK